MKKYMQCITCKNTVEMNDICICLQCQGHHGSPQKDVWQKKDHTVSKDEETNYDRFMRHPNLEEQ